MKNELQSPVHGRIRRVERDYWLMNWIDGLVVLSCKHVAFSLKGLDRDWLDEHPAARYYDPADEMDEIVNNLVKIQYRDNKSVMNFVRRYGLLDIRYLRVHERPIILAPEIESQHRDDENNDEKSGGSVYKTIDRLGSVSNFGDPLLWIFAHARTVRWCLEVTDILKTKLTNDAFLQKNRRILREFLYPSRVAIRDEEKEVPLLLWDLDVPYSLWDAIQNLCNNIITENITDMQWSLESGKDEKVRLEFRSRSLIERVYWHLAKIRVGGSVQQCVAEDCRQVFIQTDPRQRFCPPPPGEKESKCSRRDRIKRYRSDPKNRECEKRLQRERYHRQKQS